MAKTPSGPADNPDLGIYCSKHPTPRTIRAGWGHSKKFDPFNNLIMSPIEQNSLALDTVQSPILSTLQNLRGILTRIFGPKNPESASQKTDSLDRSSENEVELTGDGKKVSDYLENNFFIKASAQSVTDILESANPPRDGQSLANATNDFLLSNPDLLKESCKRTLENLDSRLETDLILNRVFEHVCSVISKNKAASHNPSLILKSSKFLSMESDRRETEKRKAIKRKRIKAPKAIQNDPRLAELSDRLESNPLALTDEESKAFLTAKISSAEFIPTDFDTAQSGHECELLIKAAKQVESSEMKRLKEQFGEKEAFDMFISQIKEMILNALNPAFGESRSFSEKNMFFEANGSNAFRLFAIPLIQEKGEKLLATCDEYQDMLEGIDHETMPNFPDNEGFLSDLEKRFSDEKNKPDYFLVSYPSRRGPVFPMAEIQALCEKHDVRLIIDACQGVGRRAIDLGILKPSVFIGSSHKGSFFGNQPVGLLAISDSVAISDKDQKRIDKLKPQFGHQDLTRYLCYAYACAPELLGSDLVVDGIRLDPKLTANVKMRQESILLLARQFVETVRMLQNESRGRALRILRGVSEPKEGASPEPMSGIFECELSGIDREIVAHIASTYGIHIAGSYYQPLEAESFRIAMHPFMDKQSILMLAHLFLEIDKLTPEEIVDIRGRLQKDRKDKGSDKK